MLPGGACMRCDMCAGSEEEAVKPKKIMKEGVLSSKSKKKTKRVRPADSEVTT